MVKGVDRKGKKATNGHVCSTKQRMCNATKRSEEEKQNKCIREKNEIECRNVKWKCRQIRRVEKGKQTYLEISSQVLDDADQQLGLTSREGGIRGVRHDCLFLLDVDCVCW
jgi:hypothetical protein